MKYRDIHQTRAVLKIEYTPEQRLANAIVELAANDYREVIRGRKITETVTPEESKKELIRFFRSEYYALLTNLDHEILIQKLDEELEIAERLMVEGDKVSIDSLRKKYPYKCPICEHKAWVKIHEKSGSYWKSYHCDKCQIHERKALKGMPYFARRR